MSTANPIAARCPSCAKAWDLPARMAGKKGRCTCGASFVIPARVSPGPITPNSAMKKCPFCAEEILAEARKCKYCGSMVDGSSSDPACEETPFLGKPGTFSNALSIGCLGIIIIIVAVFILRYVF